MTERTCQHERACIIASRARIATQSGEAKGDVRWCPDCGAVRGEFNPDEARENTHNGPWLRPGAPEVIGASAKAVAEEARREALHAV